MATIAIAEKLVLPPTKSYAPRNAISANVAAAKVFEKSNSAILGLARDG